jgi:hypothetical protein
MDCVWHSFNREKKFTNKEDHTMDLQFLDGVNSTEELDSTPIRYTNMDAQDLFGNDDDFGELGKLYKKRSPEQKKQAKEKRQHTMQKGRKVFHKINKVNPATALLRAGVLASMKLNVMKVAQAIKWGYASRELAQAKGMDMSKYDRIKNVLDKTQNIFYAAGGKPENLRKAILTGRGNRNHEVAGVDGLRHTMRLSKLLGEVYQDELVNDMEGFEGFGSLEGGEGLGEPATGTAIAAASGAMGALAALIKSIGTLFPNKGKAPKKGFGKRKNAEQEGEDNGGSSDSSQSPDTSDNTEPPASNDEQQSTEETQQQTPPEENEEAAPEDTEQNSTENLPAVNNDNTELAPSEENKDPEAPNEESTDGLAGIGARIKTFYQSNKKWIHPTAITLGVGTVLYFIYQSSQKNEEGKEQEDPLTRSIEGVKTQKKKRKRNYQTAHASHQHGVIRLM